MALSSWSGGSAFGALPVSLLRAFCAARLARMAAAARANDRFRFYATAGTCDPPNAAFRSSLHGEGALIVRESHFLASSFGAHLPPVVGGSYRVSLRLIAYVHLSPILLSTALAALPLPWYPEPGWLWLYCCGGSPRWAWLQSHAIRPRSCVTT